MNICIYRYVDIHTGAYVYIYICLYIYVYIYIYVYMYIVHNICIHTNIPGPPAAVQVFWLVSVSFCCLMVLRSRFLFMTFPSPALGFIFSISSHIVSGVEYMDRHKPVQIGASCTGSCLHDPRSKMMGRCSGRTWKHERGSCFQDLPGNPTCNLGSWILETWAGITCTVPVHADSYRPMSRSFEEPGSETYLC